MNLALQYTVEVGTPLYLRCTQKTLYLLCACLPPSITTKLLRAKKTFTNTCLTSMRLESAVECLIGTSPGNACHIERDTRKLVIDITVPRLGQLRTVVGF